MFTQQQTLLVWILFMSATCLASVERHIPQTLTNNPGNIYFLGQDISVNLVPGEEPEWELINYEKELIASGTEQEGKAIIGKLPIGYYELRRKGVWAKTTIGVIQQLKAPTPLDSPICTDIAMAWLFSPKKHNGNPPWAEVLNSCQLAGVNRTRDRLSWGSNVDKQNAFIEEKMQRYDQSLQAQVDAGMQVLSVWHDTPKQYTATNKSLLFPDDLRHAYHFCNQLAKRWQGKISAIEPWNEPDIDRFGGYTGAEISSYQKACYLALKSANPDLIVSSCVPSRHRWSTLSDFHDNQAWPYFETCNLHHYRDVPELINIYKAHRAYSAGRPMWVTECGIGVGWGGDKTVMEPGEWGLRHVAQLLPRVVAHSIYEGSTSVYWFVMANYNEGHTQMGILRHDLSPRPAYVALAACGRLLAGQKP